MSRKYICVVGQKGVGKDTFAGILREMMVSRGHSACTVALADVFKGILARGFGVPLSMFYDQNIKELDSPYLLGTSPRRLLQYFGTDMMQTLCGKEVWCNYVDCQTYTADTVIITDVRFEHEFKFFEARGAIFIFIDRLNRCVPQDSHVSESGLMHLYDSDTHFRISNDSTIDDLISQVEEIYEKVVYR